MVQVEVNFSYEMRQPPRCLAAFYKAIFFWFSAGNS